MRLEKILYSFPVILLWNTCACCNWKQHLQRLSPHDLHWPTVDEGLDTAALTSVSLMLLGRRNATTGGSGNNLASVSLFSSPDPKSHVSYCHHLASVVRRKLFQKSSPLKVLNQWKPNLVRIITRVSSFKIVSGDAVHQATWPLLLKIKHMVKLQVLGNNSKTVNNIKNLPWGKNDQHSKIYLPCNFEVNLITHLGVIALFSSYL